MGAGPFAGRADLLRALLAVPETDPAKPDVAALARGQRYAAALEFHLQPEKAPDIELPEPQGGSLDGKGTPETEPNPLTTARRPPLQARFYAVLGSESLADDDAASRPSTPLPALTAADCAPRKSGVAPFLPLVGRTRLWPALKRSLSRQTPGPVDVAALVRCLSRGESLSRLPRRRLNRLPTELTVALDRAEHLIPYDEDYALMLRELGRMLGETKLNLWTVKGAPGAPLVLRRGRQPPRPAPLCLPFKRAPLLILGDLGLLAPAPHAALAWAEFCRQRAVLGAPAVVWLPCSPAQVPTALAEDARLHCLSVGGLRAVPRGGTRTPTDSAQALETLLTLMACCVRVEPPLLRALRLLSPDTVGEPGLEGRVWGLVPRVLAGQRFCELAPPELAGFRTRFERLTPAMQLAVLQRMLALHAYRGRATESVELLIWRAHAAQSLGDGELAALLREAESWLARLAAQGVGGPGDAAAYARDLLSRQGGDSAWLGAQSAQLTPLWALTGQAEIPAGLHAEDVLKVRSRVGEGRRDYLLTQQEDELWLHRLHPQRERFVPAGFGGQTSGYSLMSIPEPGNAGSAIAPVWPGLTDWPEIAVQGGLAWSQVGAGGRWLGCEGDAVALPLASTGAPVYELVSAGNRHRIGLLSRPSWALEWGRDREGLYALAPSPLVAPVKLYWLAAGKGPSAAWPLSPRAFRTREVPLSPQLRLGADLEYGLYLDVEIRGEVQRLRWIEPGEFWMGSPQDEPERFDDEGPRHRVTLTEGYWLAETACSQGFWKAVMGKNPSQFTDSPENPVEQVSWDDVQEFLRQMRSLLGGLQADLPTEAEWEYACRAGTEEPFSFGREIHPLLANYDGDASYNGGLTGEYRKKTVPVKSFVPNAWGLYQMHGNVYEWCADGMRDYTADAVTDPRGPEGLDDGAPRVVRGGAWLNMPKGLRAAYRNQWHRGFRLDYLGFRFSLRSTSGGAERPSGLAPEGPYGSEAAPGRRRPAKKKK